MLPFQLVTPLGISTVDICHRAATFDELLKNIKSGLPGIPWYPYNSLGAFHHLLTLLATTSPSLCNIFSTGRAIDLCCADGDVAFFLEKLGLTVDAADLPATNYNHMQGVYALKAALSSSVSIDVLDIDSQFRLARDYHLGVFMGALYHLQNPYFALATLSRHVSYLLFSTYIANTIPGQDLDVREIPMAYLVDDDELNNDSTNYWVFSEAGLRRLLKRTHWETCALLNENAGERGVRVIALLRSRLLVKEVVLLNGWHPIEPAGWRWTALTFSIALPPDSKERGASVEVQFHLPQELFLIPRRTELSAETESQSWPLTNYTSAGSYSYVVSIPPGSSAAAAMSVVTFQVTHFPPFQHPIDRRELGLIVTGITLT